MKTFKKWMKENGAWDKFKTEQKRGNNPIPSKQWIINYENEPFRYISGAFDWEDSVQGRAYWKDIDVKWNQYIQNPQTLPSLKSCPFCGSTDITVSVDISKKISGSIVEARVLCFECNTVACGVTLFSEYEITEDSEIYKRAIRESTDRWNTRLAV